MNFDISEQSLLAPDGEGSSILLFSCGYSIYDRKIVDRINVNVQETQKWKKILKWQQYI